MIDRRDFAINICEMKYSEKEFTIDKAYANELENKRNVFKEATKTRKITFRVALAEVASVIIYRLIGRPKVTEIK